MTKGEHLALIIASNQYEDPELSQLQAPVQDSEALARVLSDPEIGGFEVQTLLNAPSFEVNQRIETFFKECKRNDLLLLYFSGHGIKDDSGKLYFAASNSKRKLLHSTAVPAAFVNDMMRISRSRKQVLILDCCYSGAFARGMTVRASDDIGVGEYFKDGHGQVVLTASDAMQYAFEGDRVKGEGVRSVFTHALVNGLETGEADIDKDGYVSIDELYDYIRERIVEQMPQQEPRKWAFDVRGNIIIARNPKPVTKPLPVELRQALESPYVGVREGAVRELDHLLQASDKGLILSALDVLKDLKEDDSQKVSTAAAKCLAAYYESQSEEKPEEKDVFEEKEIPVEKEMELAPIRSEKETSISPPSTSSRKFARPTMVKAFVILLIGIVGLTAYLILTPSPKKAETTLVPDSTPGDFVSFIGLKHGDSLEKVKSLFGEPESNEESKIASDPDPNYISFHANYFSYGLIIGYNKYRDGSTKVFSINIMNEKAVEAIRKITDANDDKLNFWGKPKQVIINTLGKPSDVYGRFHSYYFERGSITFCCYDEKDAIGNEIIVHWLYSEPQKEDTSQNVKKQNPTPPASIPVSVPRPGDFKSFIGLKRGSSLEEVKRLFGIPESVEELKEYSGSNYKMFYVTYFQGELGITYYKYINNSTRVCRINVNGKDTAETIRKIKGVNDDKLAFLGKRKEVITATLGKPSSVSHPDAINDDYDVYEYKFERGGVNFHFFENCVQIVVWWDYPD